MMKTYSVFLCKKYPWAFIILIFFSCIILHFILKEMSGVSEAQVTLNKLHETSRRLCKCYPHLTSKIKKQTFLNCMKDIKRCTNSLFVQNGSNYMTVLHDIGEMELSICALEKSIPRIENSSSIASSTDNDGNSVSKQMFELRNDYVILESQYARKLISSVDNIVKCIKAWEMLYEVQYQLWCEKQKLSVELMKTIDQFTYGSTAFSMWCQLSQNTTWKQHLIRCFSRRIGRDVIANVDETKRNATGTPIRVAVFGSSQGLLIYYTYMLISIEYMQFLSTIHELNLEQSSVDGSNGLADISNVCRCDGYEVMPLLFHKSVEILEEFVEFDGIEFHLQDMLTIPSETMSTYDVIVLTSLCWDSTTRMQVAKKLHSECKKGILVVDYTNDLFRNAHVDADHVSQFNEPAEAQSLVPRNIVDRNNSDSDSATSLMIDMLSSALNKRAADTVRSHTSSGIAHEHVSIADAPIAKQKENPKSLLEMLNDKIHQYSLPAECTSYSGDTSAGNGVYFKCKSILVGECTWNDEQKLYLYESV